MTVLYLTKHLETQNGTYIETQEEIQRFLNAVLNQLGIDNAHKVIWHVENPSIVAVYGKILEISPHKNRGPGAVFSSGTWGEKLLPKGSDLEIIYDASSHNLAFILYLSSRGEKCIANTMKQFYICLEKQAPSATAIDMAPIIGFIQPKSQPEVSNDERHGNSVPTHPVLPPGLVPGGETWLDIEATDGNIFLVYVTDQPDQKNPLKLQIEFEVYQKVDPRSRMPKYRAWPLPVLK